MTMTDAVIPMCKAPVPGGCKKPARRVKNWYSKFCRGHNSRRENKQPINTPIQSYRLIVPDYEISAYLNGSSTGEIARRLHVATGTVYKALKRQNVKTRTVQENNKLVGLTNLNRGIQKLKDSGKWSKVCSAGKQHVDIKNWTGFKEDDIHRLRHTNDWSNWRKNCLL